MLRNVKIYYSKDASEILMASPDGPGANALYYSIFSLPWTI